MNFVKPRKLSDQILSAHLALRDQPRLTGCISYLQRKVGCSYNRAALILAFLEDAKVIGVPDHGGFRRWLIMDCDKAVEHLRGML
jgi:DNA segregation ATPase FtsK/SpoIIIE-like protein